MTTNTTGGTTMRVEIEGERLEKASGFIIAAMNKAQRNGFTIDEVICVMMYMAGAAIKQRGGRLFLDKPLREALPPIALGYETSEHAQAWQIEAMKGN